MIQNQGLDLLNSITSDLKDRKTAKVANTLLKLLGKIIEIEAVSDINLTQSKYAPSEFAKMIQERVRQNFLSLYEREIDTFFSLIFEIKKMENEGNGKLLVKFFELQIFRDGIPKKLC